MGQLPIKSAFTSRLLADPIPPSGGRWAIRHFLVLGLALLLGSGLGWLGRQPELLLLGDEQVYLGLSQSLESGRYNDEYLPGAPRHAHYPPGLPAWLLLLRTVGGTDPDVARGANLLLLAVAAILMADAIRRISTPWWGVAVGVVIAVNPMLLNQAGMLYAETLLMAALAFSLWAALLADHQAGRPWRTLAFAGGVAAFLTRLSGVGVLAALWTWALVRKQYRWVIAGGVLSTIVVAGIAYTVLAPTGNDASRSYAAEIPPVGELGARLAIRAVRHADYYLTSAIPTHLGLPTIPGTPIDNAIWLGLLVVLGITGFVVMFRTWLPAALNLLAGGVVLLLWIWGVDRFLAPLFPWVISALLLGTRQVVASLRPRSRTVAGILVTLVFAGSAVTAAWARSAEQRACHLAPGDPSGCIPEDEQAFMAVAGFARDHLPATAVVASIRPATFHYLSGHQAIPFRVLGRPPGPSGRWIDAFLEVGATHVMVSRVTEVEPDIVAPALLAECEAFDLSHAVPGQAILLAVRPTGTGTACAPLREFLGRQGLDVPKGGQPVIP